MEEEYIERMVKMESKLDHILESLNKLESQPDDDVTKTEMEGHLEAMDVRIQAIEERLSKLEAAPAKWGSILISLVSAAAAIIALIQ